MPKEIQVGSQDVIDMDTPTLDNFQGCMESQETYWNHCIHAQGDQFKGDSGVSVTIFFFKWSLSPKFWVAPHMRML